jgi:soluble lytic murein transglycosylase-like protein
MNNGPALVIRGALLGCLVIFGLVSLITRNNQPTALAAVEQPAGEPLAQDSGNQAKRSAGDRCQLSPSYPPSIQQWCGLISDAAQQYGLPTNLIAALILQESGGQALAYSKSGAVGLMQVMPRDGIAAGFQCVNGPCFASRPTIAELQDPAFNIDYGTRFLASLVERRGSLREALVAYGPMSVGYFYADKVLGIYQSYGGE